MFTAESYVKLKKRRRYNLKEAVTILNKQLIISDKSKG